MKVMTISDVRKNFADVVDSVIDDAEECVIPRSGGKAVVIVSLDEWNSLKETMHVLGTRDNARRLFDSIDELEGGLGEVHDIEVAERDKGQSAA
jgi:antitoxin YefM